MFEEQYRALLSETESMPVIDTHEHLPWDEKDRCGHDRDVLGEYLMQYMGNDILSSGLPRNDFETVLDHRQDLLTRWRIVAPYWEYCRHTGYGRALDIAVTGIYGIDGIHENTLHPLNEAFLHGKQPGHTKRVLRDLCGIETSLVDVGTADLDGENELLKRIWQPKGFILPEAYAHENPLQDIRERHGIDVRSLSGWEDALEAQLECTLKKYGVRVLKYSGAYSRTLRFEEVPRKDAEPLFVSALNQKNEPLRFARPLQDYMMHRLLRLANDRGLTIQFHTGILAGNGNTLSNSDPMLLNNLFSMYPNVRFDLFHMGYPFQSTVSALAKMFPNVFIDLCWAHILSPSACVAALHDFLDAVPYNKISAFGGDYRFPDGIYGHLVLARETVARTLAEKVCSRGMAEGQAASVARALLYDNPKRIFQL